MTNSLSWENDLHQINVNLIYWEIPYDYSFCIMLDHIFLWWLEKIATAWLESFPSIDVFSDIVLLDYLLFWSLQNSLNEKKNSLGSVIIIIIMSCRQHGYPWPSLATSPAGLLGYILCPHIAAVCKFGLVVLLLLGHMWGSIGVCHLQAFSLLLQQCPACLARLTCIVFMMGGKWPYSWRLVGCCRQDLFNIAINILV